MNALLTLTRREIAERRPILWGTLAAALLPVLARLLPWVRPELRRELHETLALLFGITFAISLALGLGASIVGEDLAHRRLGFYFSRPIHGWTIWASKNLAATLMVLGAWVSFAVPVVLLAAERPSALLTDLNRKFPDWFLPWCALLLGLIFVAQAMAGAYRARDGLFALDIVAFATLVAIGTALGWQLYAASAETLESMVLPGLVVVAVAAAVAGAMQVIVGRTDARRGHLALFASLWGTLAVGLVLAAAFCAWVLSVTPQDVGASLLWGVRATPSGSHVAFMARTARAGYLPMFVLDTATGHFDRLPWHRMPFGFAFSSDGRRAVWIENDLHDMPTLAVRRLDAPGSSTIRSTLRSYAGLEPVLAQVSDDGREAVVATSTRIAVVDTDSGREAASVALDQLGLDSRSPVLRSRYAFVGNTVVGFFVPPPSTGLPLVVATFDFRTGRVEAGPRVAGVDWVRAVRDGRALVSGRNGLLALVDGSDVHELRPAENGLALASATLLQDGRAVALVERGGERRLLVWNREGRLTLDAPHPWGLASLSGEPRPGWIAVGMPDASRPQRTLFVDLATGAVVREEQGLLPAVGWQEHQALPAGSAGARLFVGTKGEIVRIDPETGRREAVLVAPAPGRSE